MYPPQVSGQVPPAADQHVARAAVRFWRCPCSPMTLPGVQATEGLRGPSQGKPGRSRLAWRPCPEVPGTGFVGAVGPCEP